ncbi:MAG: hypothetical protein ACKO23_05420, partial [Gemmataceae bacterium]
TAVILQELRERLTHSLSSLNQHCDRAVITLRGNANASSCEALREAGKMAGWQTVELLPASLASVAFSCWTNQIARGIFLVHELDEEGLTCSIVICGNGRLHCRGSVFLPGHASSRMIQLLADHLLHQGKWTLSDKRVIPEKLAESVPGGGLGLMAKLKALAGRILRESARQSNVEIHTPLFLDLPGMEDLRLEANVSRTGQEEWFRQWIDEGAREWAAFMDRWGISSDEPDHLLVAGSMCGFPLLKDTLARRLEKIQGKRSFRLLQDDPDLGRAFGAAIQAHSLGTRMVSRRSVPPIELLLRPTSPGVGGRANREGEVRGGDGLGRSVQIRTCDHGFIEEIFLDENGRFSQEVESSPACVEDLEWTVCDEFGREQACFASREFRWQAGERPGNASENILLRTLSLRLLGTDGKPTSSDLAPAGTALPVTITRTFHIADSHGRMVLPILVEDRELYRFQLLNPIPALSRGTRVQIEFTLISAHDALLFVKLPDREGLLERVRIPGDETHVWPSPQNLVALEKELDHLAGRLPGSSGERLRNRFQEARRAWEGSLFEMEDGPMIKSWANLRRIFHDARKVSGQTLEPSAKEFKLLARDCLDRAGKLADRTGQNREELFHHVHSQERFAEKAREEFDPKSYRECWDNLKGFGRYLDHFLKQGQSSASSPSLSQEEQSRKELERFRESLAKTWKAVRQAGREELEDRLNRLANEAKGLHGRLRSDPGTAMRDIQKYRAETEEISNLLAEPLPTTTHDITGLLEAEPGEC